MLRNTAILLVILCGVTAGFCQHVYDYEYGKFRKNAVVHAFVEKLNVREAPSLDSEIIATLPILHPFTIIEATDSSAMMDGYAQRWYKVWYEQDDEKHAGYVLEGLIAIIAIEFYTNGSEIPEWFVWNISGCDDENYLQSQAKLVSNGKVVSAVEFKPIYNDLISKKSFGYIVDGMMKEDGGFSPNVTVFIVRFSYEACGFTYGDILVTWNGSELNYGLRATNIADEIFHTSSKVVFPSQKGGQVNRVFVIKRQERFDEEMRKWELLSEKTTVFKWNGTELIKQQ